MEKELKKLIGKKIISIERYGDNSHFDSGYFIIFENGKILTAQDGEYGDNAFSFVSQNSYDEVKNKINI